MHHGTRSALEMAAEELGFAIIEQQPVAEAPAKQVFDTLTDESLAQRGFYVGADGICRRDH